MEFSIREAVPGDESAIAGLSAQLGYKADPAQFGERIASFAGLDSHMVYVAVSRDGRVVGWIETQESDSLVSGLSASITGLVVDASCRRAGVGRKLVQQAADWAVRRGFDSIGVRSNAAREGAHDFYPSLGFTLVKTQHNYRLELD